MYQEMRVYGDAGVWCMVDALTLTWSHLDGTITF